MAKKFIPTAEQLELILTRYNETKNYSLVSRETNLSVAIIKRIIQEAGETTSTDADGDVTKCQVYNIDELKIGEYVVYDVQCAVSNQTTACMLLGQEVLQKFTSVTINYENHTLKLER